MTVDWIRAGLKRTGKTRSGLAKALGRSPSAVTDLLNGHRRLRADEIATVSEYLGIEPPRLIGGGPPRPPSAPLIGYVGAGAVAHFYADGQGPFDDVDAPYDSKPATVAVPDAPVDRSYEWDVAWADAAREAVEEAFESLPKPRRRDQDSVAEAVRRGVRAAMADRWNKKPMCHVHVLIV